MKCLLIVVHHRSEPILYNSASAGKDNGDNGRVMQYGGVDDGCVMQNGRADAGEVMQGGEKNG
jgi:hypothetical protein